MGSAETVTGRISLVFAWACSMLERIEIVRRYGSWRFKSSSSCQSFAKDMYALKIAVNGIHGNSHRFRQSNHARTVLHVSSASGLLSLISCPKADERIAVSLQRVSPVELASSLKKRQSRWSKSHENLSASLNCHERCRSTSPKCWI